MTVSHGSFSGVPFAIDVIIEVCKSMPIITGTQRTSENSMIYYFKGNYTPIKVAEMINDRVREVIQWTS